MPRRGPDSVPRKSSPRAAQAAPATPPEDCPQPRGRHLFAVQEVAKGRTVRSIAKELRANESSVYDWLKRPECQAALQELLAAGRESARAALLGNVQDAADYVTGVVTGKQKRPNKERLRACGMVFDRVGLPPVKEIRAQVAAEFGAGLTDEQLLALAEGKGGAASG